MPVYYAVVQTHGSYYGSTNWTRVSALMKPSMRNQVASMVRTVEDTVSPSEAEWASVTAGLEFALEQGEESVALENDNLQVIHGLVVPGVELRHSYAKYHKERILRLATHMEWLGARWIPRERNMAVNLFHNNYGTSH
jgi:ribonuclease HI